ncbi:hypothetical protein [Marinomonas fungiae]|uniref:hypothetical protein n=1 Tax=Marinomonas fungiae TaxID=1137284 RepID=UPI003A8D2A82
MGASEHLNNLGIRFDQGRQFILNNINAPQFIYDTAAEISLTFAMIAELYSDNATEADIRAYFSSFGLNTSHEGPVLNINGESNSQNQSTLTQTDIEEHLSQFGVSFHDARQFIQDNTDSPSAIYHAAAQLGLSFDMIAGLYGDNVSIEDVKSFFRSQSLDISGTGPVESGNNDDSSEQTSPENNDIDLSIGAILGLSDEELGASDWDTLLTSYQSALMNFDWEALGDSLEVAFANVNWAEWIQEIAALAQELTSNSNWLAELSDFYSNYFDDIDSLFINLDAYDDLYDWSDLYADVLSSFDLGQLGSNDDQLNPQTNLGTFGSYDWSGYLNSLSNDWQSYLGELPDLDWVQEQLNDLDSLYEQYFPYLSSNAQQPAIIGISAEATEA